MCWMRLSCGENVSRQVMDALEGKCRDYGVFHTIKQELEDIGNQGIED